MRKRGRYLFPAGAPKKKDVGKGKLPFIRHRLVAAAGRHGDLRADLIGAHLAGSQPLAGLVYALTPVAVAEEA